jgi:hypothetical protein
MLHENNDYLLREFQRQTPSVGNRHFCRKRMPEKEERSYSTAPKGSSMVGCFGPAYSGMPPPIALPCEVGPTVIVQMLF